MLSFLPVLLRRLVPVMAISCLAATAALAHPHILRTSDRTEVPHQEMMQDLANAQVIFIGELHDHVGHHQVQLTIINELHKHTQPLAIGLEMFRKDSQPVLDRWVDGSYSPERFARDFQDNWSMWDKYREIFDYARQRQVKLVGLNIPREISGKVARHGFAALPESERQSLGNVQCVVDPEYGELIQRAMGGHGGHGQQFLFFCEAQMLWDSMMARHLAEFLKANPQYRVVVLAGSAHAWKFGIPRQLLRQMEITYRVVLPEIDGRVTRNQVNAEMADYLWLNEGPDGWSF
jgi:uncharacterized iron-regulated protein